MFKKFISLFFPYIFQPTEGGLAKVTDTGFLCSAWDLEDYVIFVNFELCNDSNVTGKSSAHSLLNPDGLNLLSSLKIEHFAKLILKRHPRKNKIKILEVVQV